MKSFLTGAALLVAATSAVAQPAGSVRGTLRNGIDSSALAGANAVLLREADSTPVASSVSAGDGRFRLDGVERGTYLLKISHAGFATDWMPGIVPDDSARFLAPIYLMPRFVALQTTTVVAVRPVLEQKLDATLINLNDSFRKAAPTVFDVLRTAPSVNLDDGDAPLAMTGKAVVELQVNGKAVRFAGRELIKFLKSLPSTAVAQVEVLTNPSAKYDLSGAGGVINLKLTKPVAGMNGTVNGSYKKAVHAMGDGSVALNWGRRALYLTGYAAYHFGTYQTLTEEHQWFETGGTPEALVRNRTHVDRWSDPTGRLGLDWFLSPKHTLGFLTEIERSTNRTTYETVLRSDAPDTPSRTRSDAPNTRAWQTYNLNYRFANAAGASWNVDVDRSYFHRWNDNTLTTAAADLAADPGGPSQTFQTDTRIVLQTLRMDGSKTYPSTLKLEGGAKLSWVRTTNDQQARYDAPGGTAVDSLRTHFFDYREAIQALYGTASRSLQAWSVGGGLRLEATRAAGTATDLRGLDLKKPDTAYMNLLPSLYVSYAPGPAHRLRASVVQRIRRPYYEDIQPFEYPIDRAFYHLYNTGLRAQRTTAVELAYTYKNKVNLTAGYQHTSGYVANVLFQQQGTTYEILQNAGTARTADITASYPLRFTAWWSSDNRATVSYSAFDGAVLDAYASGGRWSCNLYTSQRLVLPKNYIFRLTGRYAAPRQQLYALEGSSGSVSASLGKQAFGQKLTVLLGASDLFKTQRTLTDGTLGGLRTVRYTTWESRAVFLEVSVRFGSTKLREPRDREPGNGDEKDRTK